MISKNFLSLFLFLLCYLRNNIIQKRTKHSNGTKRSKKLRQKFVLKKPARIGGKGFYYKNSIKISKKQFSARAGSIISFFFFLSFFLPPYLPAENKIFSSINGLNKIIVADFNAPSRRVYGTQFFFFYIYHGAHVRETAVFVLPKTFKL